MPPTVTKGRDRTWSFRARAVNVEDFRSRVMDPAATEATATIMVSLFEVPDSFVAVGAERRQVIDRGAFRAWTEERFDKPRPYLLDHGDAPIYGYADSLKKVGRVDPGAARETAEGLEIDVVFNLMTQRGREAAADLLFDPEGTEFSFRVGGVDTTYEGDDGFEHVKEFEDVLEFTQTLFGAQRDAHLVTLRAAVGAHTTETSDSTWDAQANEGRLSNEAGATTYRKAYAWGPDPEKDSDAKSAWRFIHHEVDSDGGIGPANLKACSAGIGVLNGGRGGTTIPDEDREGVYRHLARHLKDAGRDVPELRMGEPSSAGAMRSVDLDYLPLKIRTEFSKGTDWAVDGVSFVEEVYADDESRESGFVIAYTGGRWVHCAWEMGDKGEVTFDRDGMYEVEQTWVKKGRKTSVRAAALAGPEVVEILRADQATARQVLAAAVTALTDPEPEPQVEPAEESPEPTLEGLYARAQKGKLDKLLRRIEEARARQAS